MKENKNSAEWQLRHSLEEIADRIAELAHCGEKDFSFNEISEEQQIDFPVLLRQSLVELLRNRKDIAIANYQSIDVPFQPDIAVTPVQTEELRLISPLKISLVSEETQYISDYEILDPREAVHCQREINTFIEQSVQSEEEHRGLMVYCPESSVLNEKVFSAFPCVEVIDGKLMGVLKCQACGKLTPEELTELKERWTTQVADGFGESLEQHEIRTESFGRILVSFWDNSPDWHIQIMQEESDEDLFQGKSLLYFKPYTNGITEVYDLYRIDEKKCDYLKIALVSPEGDITVYNSEISEEDMSRINAFADTIKERIQQRENQDAAGAGEEESPEISGISM